MFYGWYADQFSAQQGHGDRSPLHPSRFLRRILLLLMSFPTLPPHVTSSTVGLVVGQGGSLPSRCACGILATIKTPSKHYPWLFHPLFSRHSCVSCVALLNSALLSVFFSTFDVSISRRFVPFTFLPLLDSSSRDPSFRRWGWKAAPPTVERTIQGRPNDGRPRTQRNWCKCSAARGAQARKQGEA